MMGGRTKTEAGATPDWSPESIKMQEKEGDGVIKVS